MFERYSERARRALFFARYELFALGGEAIEPGHLLLGLIRDPRGAQRLFANWNIPPDDLRRHIEKYVVSGGQKIPTSVEVPFAVATKRVLNVAAEEADRLRHYQIEPEHLVLALLRENDGVAARILEKYEMTLDGAREFVVSQPATTVPAHGVRTVNPAVSAQREAIMQRVHDLARAEPNSPEGLALVEQIEAELSELMRLFG